MIISDYNGSSALECGGLLYPFKSQKLDRVELDTWIKDRLFLEKGSEKECIVTIPLMRKLNIIKYHVHTTGTDHSTNWPRASLF